MKKNGNIAMYYFIITYIITILLTRPSSMVQEYRVFIWIIPFLIWVISFISYIVTGDRYYKIWSSKMHGFYIYILILFLVMVITNLFSLNIFYSIASGMFSVALLWMLYMVTGTILIKIDEDSRYKKIITKQLIMIQIIAIFGNFLVSSWNWDSSVRFSGGVNPNMMALISLFSIIWFYDLKIENESARYYKMGLIMSIITLVWTLSRGRILALLFLVGYLGITKLIVLINQTSNYKFKKYKVLRNFVLVFLLILLIPIAYNWIIASDELLRRFNTPATTRLLAWDVLITGFKENILVGSYGWWNANEIIRKFSTTNMATSAHNFYLRVLSEVGIIGLFTIILLPLYLVVKSLVKAIFNIKIDSKQRNKVLLYSGAILSLLISQFVEDQYLNGIGDFQTGLFVWIFAATHYNLIKDKIVIKNN